MEECDGREMDKCIAHQERRPAPAARVSGRETLPEGLLRDIQRAKVGTKVRGHTVTAKLKRRVNFAMNVRRWR